MEVPKPISYMCMAYVRETNPQNDQKSGSRFLHFTGLQNLALNQAAKPLKPIFRSIGTNCGLCFPKMYSIGDKSATLYLTLLVFHCSSNFFCQAQVTCREPRIRRSTRGCCRRGGGLTSAPNEPKSWESKGPHRPPKMTPSLENKALF